jgi:hypothetical protein
MAPLLNRLPGMSKLARLAGLTPPRVNPRAVMLDMLPKQSVGAEIGVHLGDFSAEVLRIVRPRELHLIDPWKHEASQDYEHAWYGGEARGGQAEMDGRYDVVRARFARDLRSGRVSIHRAPSHEALNAFPDAYFDWIYIDGNHLYEFVRADLQLAFAKTAPGGYIAGDDYNEGGWWQGGVQKAVDEFTQEYTVRVVTVVNRQFVLRKNS